MSYITDCLHSLSNDRRVKVGFLGLGKSNLSLIERIAAEDVTDIVLRDSNEKAGIRLDISGATYKIGKDALSDINEDILFLAPSVRRDTPELRDAEERGVILSSDCELFFKYNTVPTIGITGSDGKSTVTTLVSLFLGAEGLSAGAIGNIGVPYSSAPRCEYYAAELSSFNLQYLSPRLSRAAITNVTPNHLNWHKSFEEYIRAKKNILNNTERTVLSCDDKVCAQIIKEVGAYAVFSTKQSYADLKRSFTAEVYYTYFDGKIYRCGEPILSLPPEPRFAEYYLNNVLCALSLTDGIASHEAAENVIHTFHGLNHRCEEFLTVDGISFIDSSIDTTPNRTATTLLSLKRQVRLILGGRGKGLSYEPLLEPLIEYADRISVYGDARDEIAAFLDAYSSRIKAEIGIFSKFDDCAEYALHGIKSGETVILSPACTAYGEFRDYEERGKHFKQFIKSRIK